MSTAVELIKKQEVTINKYKDTIFKNMSPSLFPDNYSKTRFLNNVMTSIRKNPAVAECTPASLIGSIVECATIGLTPDGITGLAHLVPFNSQTRGKECQLIIGYKGYRKLALRNPEYVKFVMRAVFEGDDFHYEFGLDEDIKHVPRGKTDNLTHVYAFVVTKDGDKIFDVMTRTEVEKVKESTRKGKYINPVWNNNFDSMAIKTVANRLATKQLDLEADVARVFANDEMALKGFEQKQDTNADFDENHAIDAEFKVIKNEERVANNEEVKDKSKKAEESLTKIIGLQQPKEEEEDLEAEFE